MAEPRTPPPVRREALWLWALAALVLLALVIVLGVRACDDEGATNSGTPTATETSFETPPANPPSPTVSLPETTPGTPEPDLPQPLPPGTRGGGTLVVGNQDLYPALAGSLAQFTNKQATGKGVRVISVVGDESFWVGRSKTQSLLVVLNLKGKSPPQVRVGQTVAFTGQLLANKGLYGVTAPGEKTVLERQGNHVFVSVGDLKLQ